MDFILQKIDRKIKVLESLDKVEELLTYYRLKIEYCLILIFAYLWNKYLSTLNVEDKEYVIANFKKPTIGKILELSKKLDTNKEIFSSKAFRREIDKYPEVRNETFGHGFVFSDSSKALLGKLKHLSRELVSSSPFIQSPKDIIVVTNISDQNYEGVNFKSNGEGPLPWACCNKVANDFLLGDIYCMCNPTSYSRLSPFIFANLEEEFFIYRNLQEPRTGRVCYNELFKTGTIFKEYEELANLEIYSDDYKIKTSNSTIINPFNRNYSKYIDIGLKENILNFLLNNRSSVCATIWGHGGVGKTATVQSICDDFTKGIKQFDYIIFLSAKDRYYDTYSGSIKVLGSDEYIERFEVIIKTINRIVSDIDSNDPSEILNSKSKVLIIIDDYETFQKEEKNEIENFIIKLDIDYHKVLITTRANIIIGKEIVCNELNKLSSLDFFRKFLTTDYPSHLSLIPDRQEELNIFTDKLYALTNGRPLFLIQLAHILVQYGSYKEALRVDVKSSSEAIDFLYGRLFDYLTDIGRNIFVAIGKLVSENDLTNLLSKLKYITNLEGKPNEFQSGIRELEKLRIIEIVDGQFFKVYSNEVLNKMIAFSNRVTHDFRSALNARINLISKDKNLEVDQALLKAANFKRMTSSEEEVISSYKQVINRANVAGSVKGDAIINLAEYLFNYKGKKLEAIKTLKDYAHEYKGSTKYLKYLSSYLWFSGQNQEALIALLEFFSIRRNLSDEYNVDLFANLLVFRCISIIEERERLKEKFKFKDITYDEYKKEMDDQKTIFVDIYDHQGIALYKHVYYNVKLMDLFPKTRQDILNSLNMFTEICIRLNRFKVAEDICKYVFKDTPETFHGPFIARMRRIEKIKAKEQNKL